MPSTSRCLIYPCVYFDGDAITCFLQSIDAASIIIIGHIELQPPSGLVSISPSLSGQKAAAKPFISVIRHYTTGGGAEFLMHEVTAIHSELMKTLSLAMFKIPWMPVCVRAHRGTDEWYCEVFDTFFNEANCLCIIFGQACNNDVWLLCGISMFSNGRGRKSERWHPVPRW